jgi:hypothetical protein
MYFMLQDVKKFQSYVAAIELAARMWLLVIWLLEKSG